MIGKGILVTKNTFFLDEEVVGIPRGVNPILKKINVTYRLNIYVTKAITL